MANYVNLLTGDPAPWFRQRSFSNPNFVFDSAAGRYVVLCFFGSAADQHSQAALGAVLSRRDLFNDDNVAFFGVSVDPDDESEGRVQDSYPGYRFFWDFDFSVTRLYGAMPIETDSEERTMQRRWVVLDPTLRVIKVVPFNADRSDIAQILAFIAGLSAPDQFAGMPLQAPIIVLPNVFEPEFCQRLIGLYEHDGGQESGFMREVDGKTVGVTDHRHKRRRDYTIEDSDIISFAQGRFLRRIVPEIEKVHQFKVTRMERYIVACYAAEDHAHFAAHRDNTTKGTAHRRFAVSVNLNDDFDGGEVSFPEYGRRSFKAPVGGAVVFSCSLLHAVSEVTRGRRYAFLPFLYDDAAARIREENNQYLGGGVGQYKSGTSKKD
ncbi:2OG-Fe(II) oxygenase [Rhizobium sp.]